MVIGKGVVLKSGSRAPRGNIQEEVGCGAGIRDHQPLKVKCGLKLPWRIFHQGSTWPQSGLLSRWEQLPGQPQQFS